MTPVVRWFRNLREKLFGKFYEGPEPPERIGEIVIVYANTFPAATRADWVRFAADHAREAYRAGYVRGVEYIERDPEERVILTQLDPDVVADALSPDWRWSPEVELQGDSDFVPRESANTEAQDIEDLLREMKQDERRGRKPVG